jgi:hypothetical protein
VSPPDWIPINSLTVNASNSTTNLAGGTAESIVYQSAPGVTAYLAASTTSGWILSSNGTGLPPSWVAPGSGNANLANTATNIAGGTAGQLLYQTAPGVTGFAGPGTSGNVLVSNGSSQPTYNNALTLSGYLNVGSGVWPGPGGTPATGEIRATNEITAYYSSDARLKENVKLIENPITLINQIRGVYFDWTDDHIAGRGGEDGYFVRKSDVGVIAQEIQNILPQVVGERDNGYLAVKYEKIVPLLIEAIKELSAEVEELKKKIQ